MSEAPETVRTEHPDKPGYTLFSPCCADAEPYGVEYCCEEDPDRIIRFMLYGHSPENVWRRFSAMVLSQKPYDPCPCTPRLLSIRELTPLEEYLINTRDDE